MRKTEKEPYDEEFLEKLRRAEEDIKHKRLTKWADFLKECDGK